MNFGLMELHKSLEDLAYVTYYWKIKYKVHFTIKNFYNMVTKQHTPTLIYYKTNSTFQQMATNTPNISTCSLNQYWISLTQQTCNNNTEIVIFFSFHTDPPLPPKNAIPFWLNLHCVRPTTLQISSTYLSILGYENTNEHSFLLPLPPKNHHHHYHFRL